MFIIMLLGRVISKFIVFRQLLHLFNSIRTIQASPDTDLRLFQAFSGHFESLMLDDYISFLMY